VTTRLKIIDYRRATGMLQVSVIQQCGLRPEGISGDNAEGLIKFPTAARHDLCGVGSWHLHSHGDKANVVDQLLRSKSNCSR